MLTDFLQDRAAAYASGSLTVEEREQFNILLEFHHELREFVAGLEEIGTAVLLAHRSVAVRPDQALKKRITKLVATRPQRRTHEALVVSDPGGLVQWVNPAFCAMCGYALEELRGKKLGPILQGPETDAAAANRLRRAVREARPCRERILNYHKNGTAYWVEVDMAPFLGADGRPLWLLARERELPDDRAA